MKRLLVVAVAVLWSLWALAVQGEEEKAAPAENPAPAVEQAPVPAENPEPPDPRHVDRSPYWQRDGKNVLAGFVNMYHASVIQVDDAEHPYRMWFFGWAAADCNPGAGGGCDAIFHARGKTLDDWEVYCGNNEWDATRDVKKWAPVLTARDKPYDEWHNGDPSVVLHDNRFYMAYSATGPNTDGKRAGEEGDTDGDLLCVMGATSPDGIAWERTEAPLLLNEAELGAPHPENQFVGGMYHRPSLLFDKDAWRLWFDYWTGTDIAMGYAEAAKDEFAKKGAFKVVRAGGEPLLHEWPNPCVIKLGTKYRCFADPSGYGKGWAGRQLAEAESDDGLEWRILGWIPPDKDTPACQVPAAALVLDPSSGDVVLALFYACQVGGEPYNWRYDRIRCMKHTIAGE